MIGTGASRALPFTAAAAPVSNGNATVNAAGSQPLIGAANGTLPAAGSAVPAAASTSARVGGAASLRPFGLAAGLVGLVGAALSRA